MATFEFLGDRISVQLDRVRGTVRIDDTNAPISLEPAGPSTWNIEINGRPVRARVARVGDDIFVHAAGATWVVRAIDAGGGAGGADGGGSGRLEAPMPGTVISVEAAEGDVVEHGAPILTIESMKLQTVIRAQGAGTVVSLKVAAGDTFDKSALLAEIEPND